jgi:hypothetical protein
MIWEFHTVAALKSRGNGKEEINVATRREARAAFPRVAIPLLKKRGRVRS